MGRLLAFMARMMTNDPDAPGGGRWVPGNALGVGVDAKTAVEVQLNGQATVVGLGYAYFLVAPAGGPTRCVPGMRLIFPNVDVYRLDKGVGKTYNFKTWAGVGGTSYTVSAVDAPGSPPLSSEGNRLFRK
jgi:cyanophycinase-like exopeptidase